MDGSRVMNQNVQNLACMVKHAFLNLDHWLLGSYGDPSDLILHWWCCAVPLLARHGRQGLLSFLSFSMTQSHSLYALTVGEVAPSWATELAWLKGEKWVPMWSRRGPAKNSPVLATRQLQPPSSGPCSHKPSSGKTGNLSGTGAQPPTG